MIQINQINKGANMNQAQVIDYPEEINSSSFKYDEIKSVFEDFINDEQNKDFIIRIKTERKIVPENAMIFIGDESYFMESTKTGEFQYRIEKPISNVLFHVEANAVSSSNYELNVVTVPSISNFEMILKLFRMNILKHLSS